MENRSRGGCMKHKKKLVSFCCVDDVQKVEIVINRGGTDGWEPVSIAKHLKIQLLLQIGIDCCVFLRQLHRRSYSQFNEIVITAMTYKFLFFIINSNPHISCENYKKINCCYVRSIGMGKKTWCDQEKLMEVS